MEEEVLHFVSDDPRGHRHVGQWIYLSVPFEKKMLEHGKRTHVFYLSEFSELVKLFVSHSHFLFIELSSLLGATMGPEFGRWLGNGCIYQHWEAVFFTEIFEEIFDICLIDTSDWVEVSRTAIILSHVTT